MSASAGTPPVHGRWWEEVHGDPCRECGTSWVVPPDRAVADVEAVPTRLRGLLAGVDPTRRHPDLSWTSGEYLAHVADTLGSWAARLAGALAGEPPQWSVPGPPRPPGGVEATLWRLERTVEDWASVVRAARARDLVLHHPDHGDLSVDDVVLRNRHGALHHVWDVSRTVRTSVPTVPFPLPEPDVTGTLDVGDGQLLRYEVSGNPSGTPAVALHGGPGSGGTPGWRGWFDPDRYRVVLFDQRGCGGSTPDAADPATDLSVNTTPHLVADVERLREHLGFADWVVLGGSWGSTLGLAYAQAHPDRVRALVLFSIATTTARDVEWVTRDMARVFPRAWAELRAGAPPEFGDGELAAAYAHLLADPDPEVRARAAAAWCAWEDEHVALLEPAHDPRYDDPVFRYRFARLVTHYWSNAGFLGPTELLDGMSRLAGTPGVLITGTADVSSPAGPAAALADRWPDGDLVLVPAVGHGSGGVGRHLLAALDRFA